MFVCAYTKIYQFLHLSGKSNDNSQSGRRLKLRSKVILFTSGVASLTYLVIHHATNATQPGKEWEVSVFFFCLFSFLCVHFYFKHLSYLVKELMSMLNFGVFFVC